MAGLPYAPAFDLCGVEPGTLTKRPSNAAFAESDTDLERQSERLARIVEGEILPRLLVMHSSPENGREVVEFDEELIEKFVIYSLSSSPASLLAVVGGLLQQGVPLESIYLDLIAPAARRLGEYWQDDQASYAEVTIALGRLRKVVRELGVRDNRELQSAKGDRAALFAPAPGEQHTFGLVLIEEFFRRSGWRTWSELSGSLAEVEAAAATHHFDLVGLSASGMERLDLLAPMIMSIRRVSRNRDIAVLVGGRVFLENPELVARVGADGMAADARDAVLKAEWAVKQLARR